MVPQVEVAVGVAARGFQGAAPWGVWASGGPARAGLLEHHTGSFSREPATARRSTEVEKTIEIPEFPHPTNTHDFGRD